MNIEHLREFVTYSHYMNMATASKKLFISQAALSTHIKALEKELGVHLVDRKAARLTKAGRALAGEANDLLRSFDDMVAHVKAFSDDDMVLTVGFDSPATDAAANWSIFLNLLLAAYPQLDYTYVKPTHSSAREVLERDGADCVIVYNCPIEADVAAGVAHARIPNFIDGRLCLLLHESHPLAKKRALRWSDLNGIKMPFASSIFRLWANSLKDLLARHGVEYESRLIAGDGANHIYDLRTDEVQLFDSGYMRLPGIIQLPKWKLVPLADDDAESLAYIAYFEDNESPALRQLLDYLGRCTNEDTKREPLFKPTLDTKAWDRQSF